MRRLQALFALCAALLTAGTAAGAFQPIERRGGELEVPRVRAGTITVPAAHRKGRLTVILTLGQPPLAAQARRFTARSATRRLDTTSRSSRAYVARLRSAQARAAATLKRAIPSARVTRSYTVLLNGIAVDLPARQLATAVKLPFARNVYPSLRYTLAMNRSPGLIRAGELTSAGGGGGEGMKIAVVDDGIDPANPFFSPAGFAYPRASRRAGRAGRRRR